MSDRRPPPECANCGATIPRDARSCPECGADERTGWRETDVYDGLDLPESAFEDDRTVPSRAPHRVNGIAWYWWWVAVLLLGGIVFSFLA